MQVRFAMRSWSFMEKKRILNTIQPYTESYQDVVDQGKREVNQGYMPPIQTVARQNIHSVYDPCRLS